jgi:outer membrane protein OmpU
MKKILLATTVLAMSAGFAAADVKVSGSASMGVARDAGGDAEIYNSGELDFGATVTSDAGVEFGMSTSVSFGNAYGFADDDGFSANDGTIGAPTLTAKGTFGTLTFSDDGVDNLYSDATSGDLGYSITAGDLSVGVVLEVNGLTADGDDVGTAEDAQDIDWSASVGYTVSGVTLSMATDSSTAASASIGYTMGAITATVGTDEGTNTITVGYAANGMSAEVSSSSDSTWSASLGYAVDAVSFDYSTDDASAWEANVSYDLGGGAEVVAGTNYSEDAFAGINLSF